MRKAVKLIAATKPFAKEVRWRSWWHFWSTLAIFLGLLVVTCLDIFWLWRLAASLLAGLTTIRMFIIYHDHQHGTVLRGSVLASIVLNTFALLVLSPRSVWRHAHNHHHRRNALIQASGIGTFPVMTTSAFAQASWWNRLAYMVSRHPLTILLGYFTIFLYGMCLIPFARRPRKHLDSAGALALHITLVSVLAVYAADVLLWTLILPLFVATALGSYLFYAQHNYPTVRLQDHDDLDFVNAALAASSYIPMNPILRWCTGNIGYHHIHHLNARIPFYRLPEAMSRIKELQTPGDTSLHPWAIYQCLRLKLWDAKQQRMVTFAEA